MDKSSDVQSACSAEGLASSRNVELRSTVGKISNPSKILAAIDILCARSTGHAFIAGSNHFSTNSTAISGENSNSINVMIFLLV